MKLYSVSAGECSWDQYDEFIVWAKSPEEALSLAVAEAGRYVNNFKEGATVAEVVKPKVSGILLGSFNAG